MTTSPVSLSNVKSGARSPSRSISASRAIGVVRVSRLSDEALSPAEQRERIRQVCEREGLTLLEVFEEPSVSGGDPLRRRHGLRTALEMVEVGRAARC